METTELPLVIHDELSVVDPIAEALLVTLGVTHTQDVPAAPRGAFARQVAKLSDFLGLADDATPAAAR